MAFISIPMPRAVRSLLLIASMALAPSVLAAPCTGNVYLTFDTGTMSQAELIARVLNEEQVKATFFVANERTFRQDYALDASWAEYWRARVAEGHVFGNHTWSHHYQRRDTEDGKLLAYSGEGKALPLDKTQFCAELSQADTTFHKLTGQHLSGMWRAPGGRTTQNSIRWAASCGYPIYIGWDDAGHLGDDLPSEKFSNSELLERAQKNIRPGSVLLMHLGVRSRKEPLAPILKPLIQNLKTRGLCFKTLDIAGR